MDFMNSFDAINFKSWDQACLQQQQAYYTLIESEEQMKLFTERLEMEKKRVSEESSLINSDEDEN